MSSITPPLPEGAGYAVVVGLGALFAVGMILTTYMLRRYQKEIITAEEFATAGRSVKTGLIAAAVVSSWTWAATLLTSTSMAYKVGISGPYYYASGACVQIVLFSTLAIKCKQKAPNAHTFLEIIKARYGKVAHSVHIFYALATNVLVTAMLLTGGSAVINELTGMNNIAACFLLPVGVIVYTLFGGIKATFLTDYAHTIVIIVIILVFAFTTYACGSKLGSFGEVYRLLREAAKRHPVDGNAGGEYLTMRSRSGGIFFVINLVGNFGTVFLDNGYFSKAFSSSPAAALPGYILGGLVWFAIPCLCASVLGLACLALENHPDFPTYPNRLTPDQVSAGLPLPTAAFVLLGKGGAVAALLLIFMAVTSAMSAELISVSTVFSYDIYRSYINPNAGGKKLIFTSHAACVIFGFAMSGFAVGLYYANIFMGYLYELMGIIISSAVVPCVLTLFWKRQNTVAVTVSPILGTGLAIMSWLVCTKSKYHEITVETTFMDDPMLTGNVVSLLSPAVFIPILTYVFKPQNFDWSIMKEDITRVDETQEILMAEKSKQNQQDSDEDVQYRSRNRRSSEDVSYEQSIEEDDKRDHNVGLEDKGTIEHIDPILSAVDERTNTRQMNKQLEEEEKLLRKASKIASYLSIFFVLSFIILWPMPMYGTGYIFSKRFFTGWIVVLIIWLFFTAISVILFPLWQGRHGIYTTFRGIYWDISGQSHKLREWQSDHPEELHVVQSQLSARLHEGEMHAIDDEI
ncbi:urea active transporter [Zygosaccharomyces mellis]|uniref:Urea active transporter n=1 Tax=Zygosaccharomyces mellis TaxID=42258 RepID=A0A4C2E6J1_9SACH|nr:urea active transporter [Zygosaccharomyces mellis]